MDQGRWPKCLAGHFMRHARCRQPPQFGIYQRQQLLGRAFFAATNRLQNLRDFSGFRHDSHLIQRPGLESNPEDQSVKQRNPPKGSGRSRGLENGGRILANLGGFPAHYGTNGSAFVNLGILDSVDHQSRGAEAPRGIVSLARSRSLTVDRHCWSGGAAASLEPSGCPSTGESTQEAGGFRTRNENLELLKAIATSKVFTEFERAFAEATGLPVALRPVESFQLSFHDCRNQGPFCALMARENRTRGACLQSQSRVAQGAVKRPRTTVYQVKRLHP